MANRNELLYERAREACWEIFGLDFSNLQVNSFPRVASVYVARCVMEGDENIFAHLKEITDAVHQYNRNLLNKHKVNRVLRGDFEYSDSDWNDILQELSQRAIIRYPGGDIVQQITGRSKTGQTREVVEDGSKQETICSS